MVYVGGAVVVEKKRNWIRGKVLLINFLWPQIQVLYK